MHQCHVCQTATDDGCNVCRRPTCDAHFFDQQYLGLCTTCQTAVEARWEAGANLIQWPWPVRSVNPAWLGDDGKVPTGLVVEGRPELSD